VRIAYTYHAFSTQRYGGVSRYCTRLAEHLARFDDCDVAVLGLLHLNEHLRRAQFNRGRLVATYLPHVPRTGWLRRRLNAVLTRRYVRRHPVDIVHETYYSRDRITPPGAKVVLTVYDMTHERHPESFPPGDRTRELKRAAVARADRIICISEHTRTDLVDLLGVDPAKTCVVHLGASLGRDASPTPLHAVPTPFVLFVGDRGGYKNFAGLVEALRAPALEDIQLVCYGGGPFRKGETLPRRALHLSGSDELLAQLYRQAAALVYPSVYEGFGLPALEAMACHCPVVCSNAGSLPEIVGTAAELFDPRDPAAIADAVERVLTSSGRAQELRTRGAERAKQFTWERCAMETRQVYRRL
jgi:glycosyltransferase involved in cell wall biosynthesis